MKPETADQLWGPREPEPAARFVIRLKSFKLEFSCLFILAAAASGHENKHQRY